jgi:hypothetical protein
MAAKYFHDSDSQGEYWAGSDIDELAVEEGVFGFFVLKD